MSGVTECDICSEFAGGASMFRRLHPGIYGRSIAATRSFRVTPTIRPLSPGHLLVWTRLHLASFSRLTNEQLVELDGLIDTLDIGRHIAFEHGVNDPAGARCGVSHAHIHLLPMPDNVVPHIGDTRKFLSYASLTEACEHDSYVFLKQDDEFSLVYVSDHEDVEVFSSQYLRRHLARFSVYPDALDWKDAVANDPDVEKLIGRFLK